VFKSVEYVGFDGHPELKAKAEEAVATLGREVGTWHDQVEVECEAYPDNPVGVEMSVTLTLPIGTGRGTRFLPLADFADPSVLASRCGGIWDRTLGSLLEKRKHVWDEIINQPAEV
jgi:hypothetical protein